MTPPSQTKIPAGGPPPVGRIGRLGISRLICGGNLFSGFAHSGDLLYVSSMLKHYFTPEKILDTLQLCEQGGINTAILRTDDYIVGILRRYRKERSVIPAKAGIQVFNLPLIKIYSLDPGFRRDDGSPEFSC